MIKGLLTAVWIVAITLASVYAGRMMQRPQSAESQQPAKSNAPIKVKSVTVPVIHAGEIQGYVLTELAIMLKPELPKSFPQPPDLLVNDEVFRTIYGEEQIDFKRVQKTDLANLSKKICENINKRAGAPVAEDVFIQELHYMTKQDANTQALH